MRCVFPCSSEPPTSCFPNTVAGCQLLAAIYHLTHLALLIQLPLRLLILCPQIWAYHIALLVAMLILTQLLLAFVLAATVFCITSLSRVTNWFLFSVPPVICSVQTNVISDDVNQTLYDFTFLRVLQMHPHQCPKVILGTAMAMILLLLMWS